MDREQLINLYEKNGELEVKYLAYKLKFDIITSLTNSYSSDQELGAKVREFVKLQEK